MMLELEIKDLDVEVEDTPILEGLNLEIPEGEVHAVMGPNGAGKSTLGQAIMGHPRFKITNGDIIHRGDSLLSMPVEERARRGVFLGFQYPAEIPGVTISNFLKTALDSCRGEKTGVLEFRKLLQEKMELLEIDSAFIDRSLNEGFSGGEKKRIEVLQMAVLAPKLAVMDETDSGLDIDSLRVVASGIEKLRNQQPLTILLITHYRRILDYITPDRVHVLKEGRIQTSGGEELAHKLEEEGYDWVGEE
jgi:Fe-S cluster assembly ATP-binding protein